MKPPITDALALALTDNARLRVEVERLTVKNSEERETFRLTASALVAEVKCRKELELKLKLSQDALKLALPEIEQFISDAGPCDHSVNICACGLISIAEKISDAIKGVDKPNPNSAVGEK